jgi:ferredoxin
MPGGEDGFGSIDTFAGIEDLQGSAFNDTLTGDGGPNRIDGGAGNDTLSGGAGDDQLIGGAGIDTLTYATAEKGVTVLQAAQRGGIYIPTLCYHPDLEPYGGCRLCIVEIENMRGLRPPAPPPRPTT